MNYPVENAPVRTETLRKTGQVQLKLNSDLIDFVASEAEQNSLKLNTVLNTMIRAVKENKAMKATFHRIVRSK